MNCSTPTSSMCVGEAVVARPSLGSVPVVFDAGGGADQDQPLDVLGVGKRGVERHASTHRVADVGAGPSVLDEVIRCTPEVGDDIARCAVTRQVDGDRLDAGCGAHEPRLDVRPTPSGLGEPVREYGSPGHAGSSGIGEGALGHPRSTFANVAASCAPGTAH